MQQRILILAFLVALFVLQGAGSVYLRYLRHEATTVAGLYSIDALTQNLKERAERSLPGSYSDFSVTSANEAKRRRLFWPSLELAASPPWILNRRGFGMEAGFGLRVRESPVLLNGLFPGYGSELKNARPELWDAYFSRSFNSKQWIPALADTGMAVSVPWGGCLDVYRELGTDILLLGTSETYRGIIPEELSTRLGSGTRVLSCARGGMYLDEVTALVNGARQAPFKARWAVWGVSPWNLEASQKDFAGKPERRKQLQAELAPYQSKVWHLRGADLFGDLSWAKLFPLTLSELRMLRSDPSLTKWRKSEEDYWWETDRFVFVPKKSHGDALIQAVQDRIPPLPEPIGDCELDPSMKARFEATLANLQEVSDRVLLYVPPVTDTFESRYQPCFKARFEEWVQSQENGRTVVFVQNAKSYGLTYDDYVYPSWLEDWNYLNGNHVNYGGAKRVTAALAKKMLEASAVNQPVP